MLPSVLPGIPTSRKSHMPTLKAKPFPIPYPAFPCLPENAYSSSQAPAEAQETLLVLRGPLSHQDNHSCLHTDTMYPA